MRLSNSDLEIIRQRPQSTNLYLSIFSPRIVLQARVNDANIQKGERTITYDSVTFGSDLSVESGFVLYIGSSLGAKDIGMTRIRSITPTQMVVAENSDINWADNQYLTVYRFLPILPIYPRIINDPNNIEDVIFYKDYDIPYTNQNTILGTFVNMGSHRAGFIENGSTQFWYTSSGTCALATGVVLSYDWAFEGGSPTGSVSANPGYVTYNEPGQYVTRLIISGSNGSVDKSYRYVSVYNPISSGTNLPYIQWNLDSLDGSRDEGGYTASVTIYQASQDVEEGSVVVIFSDDWYGSYHQSLGGNGQNNSSIFFVGYVMDGSIKYDYEKSTIKFDIGSITRYLKEMDGFSVSVESNLSPTKWFQLLDLDVRRAIYHYLRWHSTVLSTVDISCPSNDEKIQFFDSDRSSLFDAIDNFMRSTVIGKIVADRQGKIWAERDITLSTTGTVPSIMEITARDWMESPNIDERIMPDLSYLELGGINFSGIFTGTFSAIMACAPGGAPSYRGGVDRRQGLALTGQSQLNEITRNLFAFRNYKYPSIDISMAGSYRNLDIAPQEPVNIIINPSDTVRRVNIRGDFNPNSVSWQYSPEDLMLLPRINFSPVVNGSHSETIPIPDTPDTGGFNTPSIQVPNVPSMAFPASYGAIASANIRMIEFGMDGTSTIGNLWCPINSVTDQIGDTSWIQYTIGTSPSFGILTPGLYGVFFQTGIDSHGQTGKVFTAAVLGGFAPGACITFGISTPDENGDIYYINCSSIFEMPNAKYNFPVGPLLLDPPVYIYTNYSSPAFDTFHALLKVVKYR